MEASFWHKKWHNGETGFHQHEVNASLIKYLPTLDLNKQARLFLPLCGKTQDIEWLLQQGFSVVGAELSELAIEQLFAQLKLTPEIIELDNIRHYRNGNLDIFVGDIFHLSAAQIGHIDAIYDRAALVALPEPMRDNYSQHLIAITQGAPQLLLTVEYDQSLKSGPPFAVAATEVSRHYQGSYQLRLLTQTEVAGGLKGGISAHNQVWLLSR
ncbi:thiopurine S-methyltransferase [Ferrimonas lipolytica]|uniref:Thiopurine S-methyltransferase n=1 Tax=Ferrimonas lipolytica TaxID=2724191 RepID=A0A6H1UA89_9GAMM|nr:thiopurine S-methyltransferase [Ferrimonas lipolytica]QIZ75967.1 thiopurine S-methyltransferase [Ferrimonas lipolytica]